MKTKEQIIEDMKKVGYEEITHEEYMDLPTHNTNFVFVSDGGNLYFKEVEPRQDVFENVCKKIRIDESGIEVIDKICHNEIYFGKNTSVILLAKVIDECRKRGMIK